MRVLCASAAVRMGRVGSGMAVSACPPTSACVNKCLSKETDATGSLLELCCLVSRKVKPSRTVPALALHVVSACRYYVQSSSVLVASSVAEAVDASVHYLLWWWQLPRLDRQSIRKGAQRILSEARHWWVGGFSGTGDCRPRSPSGAIIIAEIHAWIRDREQVKTKGFIRMAAKLYNCVGAPLSALKVGHVFLPRDRGFGYNYHIRLQPKRVVQFLAQQHTPLWCVRCGSVCFLPTARFFLRVGAVAPTAPEPSEFWGTLRRLHCSIAAAHGYFDMPFRVWYIDNAASLMVWSRWIWQSWSRSFCSDADRTGAMSCHVGASKSVSFKNLHFFVTYLQVSLLSGSS